MIEEFFPLEDWHDSVIAGIEDKTIIMSPFANEWLDKANKTLSELQPEKQLEPLEIIEPLGEKVIDEFIGQSQLKEVVRIHLISALRNNKAFPHSLLAGNPGLGKTRSAKMIAAAMGGRFREYTAGSLKKIREVISLIEEIRRRDVVFIDEIHSLELKSAEELYSVMQDFEWRTNKLSEFTLIGATTDAGLVPKPLLDRFIIDLYLEPYTDEEIIEIVVRDFNLSREDAKLIAKRSFGTPRLAIKYARHIIAGKESSLDTDKIFELLHVDISGLTKNHLRILAALYEYSYPIGIEFLSQVTNIKTRDIYNIYEPNLLRLHLITKTRMGRVLTEKGVEFVTKRLGG